MKTSHLVEVECPRCKGTGKDADGFWCAGCLGIGTIAVEPSSPLAADKKAEQPDRCGCRSRNECCAPDFPGCRRDELPETLAWVRDA